MGRRGDTNHAQERNHRTLSQSMVITNRHRTKENHRWKNNRTTLRQLQETQREDQEGCTPAVVLVLKYTVSILRQLRLRYPEFTINQDLPNDL